MTCIVIDNGSDNIRAGFAGDQAPKVTFPTVVGTPRQSPESKEVYYGNEAVSKRGQLRIRYPIEHGIITNWDMIEELWRHAIEDWLKVSTEESPILMADPPFIPKYNREKMTQIMFESFNCPAFYLASQPVLALIASGRVSGAVLTVGGQNGHVVPVWEGNSMPHASLGKNLITGRDLTWYLTKLLGDKGHALTTTAEIGCVKSMKQDLCYCAIDYDMEIIKADTSKDIQRFFQLPDGKTVIVDKERFQCPELLFKPQLGGMEIPSTQEMIKMSINKVDKDIQKDLFNNIVVSGGSTMFSGFPERLEKEVAILAPTMKTRVVSSQEKNNDVWVGGSILASKRTFQQNFITKEEYDEYGPSLIHNKC